MDKPPITVPERDYDHIDAPQGKTGDNVPGIRELRAQFERSDVVTPEQ